MSFQSKLDDVSVQAKLIGFTLLLAMSFIGGAGLGTFNEVESEKGTVHQEEISKSINHKGENGATISPE